MSAAPAAEEVVGDPRSWGRIVATRFAAVDVVPGDRRFRGRIASTAAGGIGVYRIAATGHRVQHGRRHLAREMVVYCYQLGGRAVVSQGDRAAELRPGDVTVYTTERPYELAFDDAFECIGVVLPVAMSSIGARRLDALTAEVLPAADPTTAAAGAVVDRLQGGLAALGPYAQGRFLRHAVDVLETLVTACALERSETRTPDAERLAEALAHIDAHLDDFELSASSVAASVYVSLRSLHALFERSGTTVAATIRARRLERVRHDLADPERAAESVAWIGTRWGFRSASHLSAAFRRAYGVTPTEYRVTALGAG